MYSNSLTQHRRRQNLNVPLPQFNFLLTSSFLRHLIKQVPYVYTSISILTNTVVRYVFNVNPLPQLWLCVVKFRNRFKYTNLYTKCKLTHWDSVSFNVVSMSWSIFERLINGYFSQSYPNIDKWKFLRLSNYCNFLQCYPRCFI